MIEHAYPHRSPRSRYVTTTSLPIFDSFAAFCETARAGSSSRHHDAARPDLVRRDFAPRPVSSHKGLPTDDVVPCLLRPICSSAISVAAIARGAFSPSVSPCLFLLLRVYVFQRARILAMADGVHACVCVYIHTSVLSWLNSRSAGTNYNEPRLVGRESAMFSFLCPVVYRPFYRGHPPPSRLATLEADLAPHPTSPAPSPSPSISLPLRIPVTIPPTRLSSTPPLPRDLLTMRNPPAGGEKNFSFLKPGQKERLENLPERYLAPYCAGG